MKLLIITQAVNEDNPVLSFFVNWIKKFNEYFEKVSVICLEKGRYELPSNIKVLSLGKEDSRSRTKYIKNFYKYIWQERKNYDAVFVHMNQEYVLLGWKIWKLFGKKIYMWRNHAKGSFWTKIAVLVSDKVFYTSPHSFTARFKKSIQMPAGIDTDFFKPDPSIERVHDSYLFMGRIAPIKKVKEFIEWFNTLDVNYTATIAGDALPRDLGYKKLIMSIASSRIRFTGAYSREEEKKLLLSHETYVNLTPSGSMDKTILEAAACGTKVKVENEDLKILEDMDAEELRRFVTEKHDLRKLFENLKKEI